MLPLRAPALRVRSHLSIAIGAVAMAAAVATTPAVTADAAGRGAVDAADDDVRFDATEVDRILQHGPWPVPQATARDPSNRVSGHPPAIALGRALFHERRLSASGEHACASCHEPARAFTDGRPRSRAAGETDRNTPSLLNLGLHRWFGWSGRSDNLWAQSLHPIVDARELGATAEHVQALIASDPALTADYVRVFGELPSAPPAVPTAERAERVLVDAAKALAAWQETLVSGRTAFDDFRDALALIARRGEAGDGAADDAVRRARGVVGSYPAAAKRGLKLFVGDGQCRFCHFGPNFTNGEFHAIGLGHFIGPGQVDAGRYGGIDALRRSRFNRNGPFSDAPAGEGGLTARVVQRPTDWGAFRVPSLRELRRTAPYMHDGSLPTLEAVVRHYSTIDESRLHQDGERLLRPLGLTDAQVADLVAFLETLGTGP